MPPETCSRDEAQVHNNNKNKTKINSGTENKRKQTKKKKSLNIAESSYLRRFDSSGEKLRLGYKTNFVQKVVTPYSLDY